MLVVDTSAAVAAVVAEERLPELVERLASDGDLHAPHLIDVEWLHALRRLVAGGHLSSERAADARTDFGELAIARYSHEPLADRIWALRENLTAYDAAFVALAEALGAPLVTCDASLASASSHGAEVEVFGTPGGGRS